MNMNKQLSALFLCNLAILFVGFGVFPLLPVYAAGFGATPAMIGLYLALTYIAISLGNMLPGWLSRRISQKVVFVSSGLLGVPALMLLGQAAAFWQVVALTATVWFTGGVGIALVAVFTGRSAGKDERGKWFSLIALTTPLGAVIGGSAAGWLVKMQGYPIMFAAFGLVYALYPLAGVLLVKDNQTSQTAGPKARSVSQARPDRRFLLLVWIVLLVAMTISISRLGLSLSMKASQFSPAAIAGTNVIGGLVTIPFVLGLGLLSDRLGRRPLLAFACLLAALSTLLLLSANQLWHFWIASAAVLVARSLSGSLASALATDIVAPEALGKVLPRLSSMNWVAGVLGFAGTGYVIETLGANSLYWMGTAFSLAAVLITGLMIRREQRPAPEPCPPQVDCLSRSPAGSSAD
jgi:MFS family permease